MGSKFQLLTLAVIYGVFFFSNWESFHMAIPIIHNEQIADKIE